MFQLLGRQKWDFSQMDYLWHLRRSSMYQGKVDIVFPLYVSCSFFQKKTWLTIPVFSEFVVKNHTSPMKWKKLFKTICVSILDSMFLHWLIKKTSLSFANTLSLPMWGFQRSIYKSLALSKAQDIQSYWNKSDLRMWSSYLLSKESSVPACLTTVSWISKEDSGLSSPLEILFTCLRTEVQGAL